jgi:hypothetical protein
MVKVFAHKSLSKKYYFVKYSGELSVKDLDLIKDRFLLDFSNETNVVYIAEFSEDAFVTDRNFVESEGFFERVLGGAKETYKKKTTN